eukprot:CFRG0314T1
MRVEFDSEKVGQEALGFCLRQMRSYEENKVLFLVTYAFLLAVGGPVVMAVGACGMCIIGLIGFTLLGLAALQGSLLCLSVLVFTSATTSAALVVATPHEQKKSVSFSSRTNIVEATTTVREELKDGSNADETKAICLPMTENSKVLPLPIAA